jgi:tetratricopeptide (TPR) repeat protein
MGRRARSTKKSSARKRTKASKRGKQSTEKGRLLEEIVARMHNSPRFIVERNARVQPQNRNSQWPRDIDVLLSSRVVSRPAKYAIECKNLGEKVDIEKIDAFVGKLSHVGIPHEHGIYISTSGYTRDALERALPAGIKLLTLTGLTDDHLSSATSEASQFSVFYLCHVTSITVTNNVEKVTKGEELLTFFNDDGKPCGSVADLVWNKWQEGEPRLKAREYEIPLNVPAGWHQIVHGKREPVLGIWVQIQVWALALKIKGESTHHALVNAHDGVVERSQFNVAFDIPVEDRTVHTVHAFKTEAELNAFINESGSVHLIARTKLPRIQWSHGFFYPLSRRVAQLLKERSKEYLAEGMGATPLPNIAEVEGTDLRAMWEPLIDGYPGKLMPVIVSDEKGNGAIDVTALLSAKKYGDVIALRERLKKHPNHALAGVIHDAYLAQGGEMLDKSEEKSGAEALRLANRAREKVVAALRVKPDSARAHHNLGVVLKNMRRYRESVVCFDRALLLKPDSFRTWTNRAQALLQLKEFDEALASYDRALALRLDDAETLYYRSGLLMALGRYEESVVGYAHVLNIVPGHFDSWDYHGLALHRLARYEEALASFDKAIEIEPENGEAWGHRGMALHDLGRYDEALSAYDKALSLKPGMTDVLINRGGTLNDLGRYEEAVKSFDQGLARHKGSTAAWNTRGVTLGRLGRLEEALESYEKALEISPDDRMVLTNCGITLSDLGRHEEAIASFDRALEADPRHAVTLHSRGLAFYRLGCDEEAVADYDRALAVDAGALDTWCNKGLALAELERWDEALEAANEGLRLASPGAGLVMPLLIRAKIYYMASRHSDAAEEIVTAWKLDPDRVLSMEECCEMFSEIHDTVKPSSGEHAALYAQVISAQEAATVS